MQGSCVKFGLCVRSKLMRDNFMCTMATGPYGFVQVVRGLISRAGKYLPADADKLDPACNARTDVQWYTNDMTASKYGIIPLPVLHKYNPFHVRSE